MRDRSSILFDTILVYGARAAHGIMSKMYQTLHKLLRQHTSDLVLRLSGVITTSVEDIQALLVIASYSDSGAVLVDIALHAANTRGLAEALESLLESLLDNSRAQGTGACIDRAVCHGTDARQTLGCLLQPEYTIICKFTPGTQIPANSDVLLRSDASKSCCRPD